MNDLLPIHNLMNEWYSRDISKKVRAMIRQKGNSGQSIASKLPYGYYNTSEDKQTWLIDESAANVVRRIFDLYLNQSFGMYQIARILKAEGIPRPTYHRRMAKGIKVEADDLCVWSASVVRDILQHREYIGDTVNFRTEITSYKNKKVIHNSDDKLKIFPNTHPAIIDKETFQKVQNKISKVIRHTRNVHSYLFADYLYCMDCHSRMHGRQCYLKGGRTLSAYECSTYRKSKGCCFHGVPEMYLQAEVLAKIQSVLAFAKSNSAEFRQNISKALEEQSDGSKAVIQEELDKAQARTAEIDKYIQGLFEAKVRGEIDGSLFASLKKTYDEEKEQLNKLIIDLITKLSRENEADEKIQLLYAAIRKYDAVWELTPEVLTDFIENHKRFKPFGLYAAWLKKPKGSAMRHAMHYFITVLLIALVLITPIHNYCKTDYFKYNDTVYVNSHYSWFEYDDDSYDYNEISRSDVPQEVLDNKSLYGFDYSDLVWDSSIIKFENSGYYEDHYESSGSSSSDYDSDYDWDSGDSWDSGGSDWDSDW